MNIFNAINNEAKIQAMKVTVSAQKGQVTKLTKQLAKLQALVQSDILSLTRLDSTYKGNEYQDYGAAVTAIEDKYNGTAKWGVMQTANIVDLRAVFVINEGPKVVARKPGANKEIDWANKFLEYNDIDKEVAQQFATEAEIEGKIAIKLTPVKTKDKDERGTEVDTTAITARYISWLEKKYDVKASSNDYFDYQTLSWTPTGQTEAEVLKAPQFVYKKFGGRINNPNSASPKVMKCLTQVDDLSVALRDWREINRLFAGPILYMKLQNKSDVKEALELFEDKNFKIKKTLAGIGELSYIQLDINGIDSLEREIVTIAKMIAGTTGVSVQYLGLADLLKNRSTSDDLREMLTAATTRERQIWKGAYEELIKKAMVMFNEMEKKTPLNPNKIGVEIPVVTQAQWQHIQNVFLPAAIAGKIDDETFLEQIPSIDVQRVMKRKEAKDESELEGLRKENADMRLVQDGQDPFGNQNQDEEEE